METSGSFQPYSHQGGENTFVLQRSQHRLPREHSSTRPLVVLRSRRGRSTQTEALWVLEGPWWVLWAGAWLGDFGGSSLIQLLRVEAPLCAGNLLGAATLTVVDEQRGFCRT